MLKAIESMKEVACQAADALRTLLEQVSAIQLLDIEHGTRDPHVGIDIVAHIDVSGTRRVLVCEVKSSGQPRHVAIDRDGRGLPQGPVFLLRGQPAGKRRLMRFTGGFGEEGKGRHRKYANGRSLGW